MITKMGCVEKCILILTGILGSTGQKMEKRKDVVGYVLGLISAFTIGVNSQSGDLIVRTVLISSDDIVTVKWYLVLKGPYVPDPLDLNNLPPNTGQEYRCDEERVYADGTPYTVLPLPICDYSKFDITPAPPEPIPDEPPPVDYTPFESWGCSIPIPLEGVLAETCCNMLPFICQRTDMPSPYWPIYLQFIHEMREHNKLPHPPLPCGMGGECLPTTPAPDEPTEPISPLPLEYTCQIIVNVDETITLTNCIKKEEIK